MVNANTVRTGFLWSGVAAFVAGAVMATRANRRLLLEGATMRSQLPQMIGAIGAQQAAFLLGGAGRGYLDASQYSASKQREGSYIKSSLLYLAAGEGLIALSLVGAGYSQLLLLGGVVGNIVAWSGAYGLGCTGGSYLTGK